MTEKMVRLLVVGPPGAGKTSLSDALSKEFNFAVMHTDETHFIQDPTETAADIDHFFAHNDRLVLDGNYACCFRQANRCHAILFVQTPRITRLKRVICRCVIDWIVQREDNGTGRVPLSPWVHIWRLFFDWETSILAQSLGLTTHSDLLARNLHTNEKIVYPVHSLEDAKCVVYHLLETPMHTLSAISRENRACSLRERIVNLGEDGTLNALWADERSNWFHVETRRNPHASWTEIVERRLNNPRRAERFATRLVAELGVDIFPVANQLIANCAIVFGCPHYKTNESDIDVLAIVDDATFHAIQSQHTRLDLDELLGRLVRAGHDAKRAIDLNVGVLDAGGQLKVTLKGRSNMTQAIVASTMHLHQQPVGTAEKITLAPPADPVTLAALTAALVHHIIAFTQEHRRLATREDRYERAASILENWKTTRSDLTSGYFKTLAIKAVQCALLCEDEPLRFLKPEMVVWSAKWNDATPLFLQRRSGDVSVDAIDATLRGYATVLRRCFAKAIGMFKWSVQCLNTANLVHPSLDRVALRAIMHGDCPEEFHQHSAKIMGMPRTTWSLPTFDRNHLPAILRPCILFANGQRSEMWYEKYKQYERNGTLGPSPLRQCIIRGCVAELLVVPMIDFTGLIGDYELLLVDALTDGRRAASPDAILWRPAMSDACIVEVKTMQSRPQNGSRPYWRAVDIATKQIQSSATLLPFEARAPHGVIVFLTPDPDSDNYYADITLIPITAV